MTSYIKVSPEHLIKMLKNKHDAILKEKNDIVEGFIEKNIKPERSFLFFFKKKAITREDVLEHLYSDFIDDFGHNYGPNINLITHEVRSKQRKIKQFLELIRTAKKSNDKMIRLSIEDNQFLSS